MTNPYNPAATRPQLEFRADVMQRGIATVDKLRRIKVGDQVWVKPGFGTQPAVLVTVTGIHADIKRGRPGIDYADRWAYLDQVTLPT